MAKETASNGTVAILNVGTKILLKDTMDQFIRTLGDYKTHYASNMQSALRTLKEAGIDILNCEVDFNDGSVFRLLRNIDWSADTSDLFVILAIEEDRKDLRALAEELEVHAILTKPFSAADLKTLMTQYETWKALPKQPWQLLVREAKEALRENRFRQAEGSLFQAVKGAPNNPVPVLKFGEYYIEKMQYDMAEKFLKKALELKPDYVAALSAMGSLKTKTGQFENAREYFLRAQALSPLNPDRIVAMVQLQVDWSIEMCKQALRTDPGASAARYLLGKLHALDKDYAGAAREIEAASPQLHPDLKSEAQTFLALARKLGGLAK
ncbi:MAG: tetratricopeptide repeat protein [Deltaproteobacteria bacterium]|nr:tetratricopeptide repeat protein [Deltaproteobacteria bacterium]